MASPAAGVAEVRAVSPFFPPPAELRARPFRPESAPLWHTSGIFLSCPPSPRVCGRDLHSGGRQTRSHPAVEPAPGQPLSTAVVRIYDSKHNKLLDSQVTDRKGRYGFIVGQGKYYLMVEKAGYMPYRSGEIDFSKKKEGGFISYSVNMANLV